jgi:hypothetical protein
VKEDKEAELKRKEEAGKKDKKESGEYRKVSSNPFLSNNRKDTKVESEARILKWKAKQGPK